VLPTADVTVDVFGQDQGEAGIVEFGLVTVGFSLSQQAQQPVIGSLRPRLAPVGRGFVRLTAPGDLGLDDSVLAPEEFAPASGRTLTTTLRLGGTEAEILVAALERDLRALGATAWLEMPGVAQRIPGSLAVRIDRFLGTVWETWPDGVVSRDELAALVDTGTPALTVTTTTAADRDDEARALTDAVVDRLLGHLGTFVAPEDARSAGAWSLPQPGAPATAHWELDQAVVAPRSVRLMTDPIIDSTVAGRVSVDVRRHAAGGLPDGHHRITLRTTVPDGPVGVLDVGVELTAAAAPPDRPFAVTGDVRLADLWSSPTRTAQVELTLGVGEPLAYAMRATSILQTASGLVPVEGTARPLTDSTPVLNPDDLALRFIPVQATDSLLARADVAVTLTAGLSDAAYVASTRLGPATPIAHLALPTSGTEPSLIAVAVDRTSGRATAELGLPVAGALLDLFAFPDPPWAPAPGRTSPTEAPMTSLDIADLRLTRLDRTQWAYAPLTAGLARAPDGRPQLAIMTAGATGHLAVTTTLLATDAQLHEARDVLLHDQDVAAHELALVPELILATDVSLLLRGDAGGWTVLATGNPSGTFLQECAFSVPLDAGRLDVVRRATRGEHDLLRVTYALVSRPHGATSSSTATNSGSSVSSSTVTTRSSSSGSQPFTSTTTRHDEDVTTAATSTAPHETVWTVTTDAASWEAGPPP
jgi:hypothetical protein